MCCASLFETVTENSATGAIFLHLSIGMLYLWLLNPQAACHYGSFGIMLVNGLLPASAGAVSNLPVQVPYSTVHV